MDKLDKILAHLQTGHFFGELSLMLGVPRTATVKAVEDTLLFSIHSKQFEKLLRNHSELRELIIQQLAKNKEELMKARREMQKKGLLLPEEEDTNIVAWVRKRLQTIFSF